MGAENIGAKVAVNIDELIRENGRLRSEIAWRKEEAVRLKRSIGTGRVYTKLREGLRDAEEDIQALRKRVVELEAQLDSRERTPAFDIAHLKRMVKGLVKAGNGMQHGEHARCLCDKCAEWRRVKDELARCDISLLDGCDERGMADVADKIFALEFSKALNHG